MASEKNIFEANTFEARIFGAGVFRGTGTTIEIDTPGVEYRVKDGLKHYNLSGSVRTHYRTTDNRKHYWAKENDG